MKRLTTELAESVQQVLSNGELHVVPKARIYEQIADQVEQFILKELAPGDRLPTERDLARMLAVSRCSLRDALLRLEMLGVVDSRQGRGTVVREVDANALIPPLATLITHKRPLVRELLEFRLVLEPPLAAKAAVNATRKELAAMQEILGLHAMRLRNGDPALEEDWAFHHAIARASHNVIGGCVLDTVMDLLWETWASSSKVAKHSRECLRHHRGIMAAITRRERMEAASAMNRHIRDMQRMMDMNVQKGRCSVLQRPAKRDDHKY